MSKFFIKAAAAAVLLSASAGAFAAATVTFVNLADMTDVPHHPSPLVGRVAEAEAIAERGRVGAALKASPSPPGRSLRSRPPTPCVGGKACSPRRQIQKGVPPAPF